MEFPRRKREFRRIMFMCFWWSKCSLRKKAIKSFRYFERCKKSINDIQLTIKTERMIDSCESRILIAQNLKNYTKSRWRHLTIGQNSEHFCESGIFRKISTITRSPGEDIQLSTRTVKMTNFPKIRQRVRHEYDRWTLMVFDPCNSHT